jgi:hypothetical protein
LDPDLFDLKLFVVVPANVRQAKDSRQNEGVDVAAETKAFILKEQSTKISFETVLLQ